MKNYYNQSTMFSRKSTTPLATCHNYDICQYFDKSHNALGVFYSTIAIVSTSQRLHSNVAELTS